MVESPPDFVSQIRDYIIERISEDGVPVYISPEMLSNLTILSDLTYPKTDIDDHFKIDWLMEVTGNDNLRGKRYRIKRGEYYSQLRFAYERALMVWVPFRISRLHKKIIAWVVNYLNNDLEKIWKSQSWKNLHDIMVYEIKARTPAEMERYIPEAVVFMYYQAAFRDIGLPFFVAGRGNPDWWNPDFFDWSQYKFDNIIAGMSGIRIDDLITAGTVLPAGFTAEELMDLRRRLRELVLRAADRALNGPA